MKSKITPEEIGKAFDLGMVLFQRLKGKEIKTTEDVLELLKIISEVSEEAKKEFEGEEVDSSKSKPNLTLKELLAEVNQIEKDSVQLNFLTGKVKEIAKKKGMIIEEVEKYVMLGLKIFFFLKLLI